jgi:hypothetical protein
VRLTASKRSLFARCQFWARPGVPWDENSSAHAEAGTSAHEGFAAHHDETAATLGESARRKVEAAKPLIDALKAHAAESWAEMAFAWDPATDTGRVLGVGLARAVAYAKARDDEMTGTADIVVRRHDGSLGVRDFKNRVPGRTVDAAAQLDTLGLFAARALGAHVVDTGTLLSDEEGVVEVPGRTLTDLDLDMEASSLQDAVAQIAFDPEPTPGPWCKGLYCPAAAQCPATVDALAETMPAEMIVREHRLSGPLASQDEAAFRLRAFDAIEIAVKVGREQLRSWADAHDGIPLADGTVWAGQVVPSEKPMLDVPGAVQAIVAAGGEAAIDSSTTWAALGRVLGKAKAADLRKGLAAMGAVKKSSSKRYEPRKRSA